MKVNKGRLIAKTPHLNQNLLYTHGSYANVISKSLV